MLWIRRCLSNTTTPGLLPGLQAHRTAAGPESHQHTLVTLLFAFFQVLFTPRCSLAFLSDCYCIPACFKEGKRGKNYFPSNDAPSNVTSESPPGFCACSTNHAGNSLSSQDFGHCLIPVGCLEGSSISATSLQACTAHGPCKSLITHRLQILLESAQHSR